MSTLALVLEFVFGLACLLFVARFLLQAAQADFYNPLSQAIVKASDPICKPLRSIIKPIRIFDLASLLVAWLDASLHFAILFWLAAPDFFNIGVVLWRRLVDTVLTITQFYIFAIFIIVIASFLMAGQMHPALALIHQLIEPIMAPFRKVIPPFGPLDLTPMVVLLILFIVQNGLRQALY